MWNVSSHRSVRAAVAARPVLAAALALAASLAALTPVAAEPRPIALDDLYALKEVSGVQISPDGKWVAYEVETVDAKRDKHDTDLYMTSWDGVTTVRLTSSPESEHTPRFSPDGRYIGFLTKREYKPKTDQRERVSRDGSAGA